MAAPRDPEVARIAVESLKLVVQAEMLYGDLEKHNAALADFLSHASRYTEGEGDNDGAPQD